MARINFEETVWFDPRFIALHEKLNSRLKAAGALICFWRLAQECFKNGQLISEDQFKISGLPEELFECQFAVKSEHGIYAKGSEKHFKWLSKSRENGKKGGSVENDNKKNAALKRENSKKIQKCESNDFNNLAQATTSHHKPPPTSFSTSSSISSSISKKKESILNHSDERFHTDFDFEILFNKFPKRKGHHRKAAGMRLLASRVKTKVDYDNFSLAVDNYFDYIQSAGKEDTQFVLQWATFVNGWEEWLVKDKKNSLSWLEREVVAMEKRQKMREEQAAFLIEKYKKGPEKKNEP